MPTLRNAHLHKERRRQLRRTMTPAERILWCHLRSRGLNGIRFARQYGVGPYVLDFCAPAIKLAVELDGPIHTTPEAIRHDRRRTEFLAANGFEVLRFWNEEVYERIDFVLERIAWAAEALPPFRSAGGGSSGRR